MLFHVKQKNRKRRMRTACFFAWCLVICAVVSGCGSEPPSLPVAEEVTEYTIQEYLGDTPVSMETAIPYEMVPGATYFYQKEKSRWEKTGEKAEIPARGECLLYRFSKTDGTVAEAFLFKDEKYNYLELPGQGVWREKISGGLDRLPWEMKKYRNQTFYTSFVEDAANGRLALPDTYNGAGKAVWIDLSGESIEGWWDRFIPDEFTAARPEDVRYVLVAGLMSKTYDGYWYNPATGEKVSDAYHTEFSVAAYDLVTGEEETIEDGVTMFHGDRIKEYFTGK